MIKTAKAYAEDPAIKDKIAEFKVVSTGTDAPGPARRHRGLHQPGLRRHRHHRRLARRLRPGDPPRRQERRRHRALRQRARHRRGDAGQRGPARDGPQVGAVPRRRAQGRRARPAARSSRSAACPATRSTATARSASTRCFDATGGDWEIVQVVGNWDDGTAQKVTADAIAVHGQFDGVTVQGGSTGTVQAMMDAGHPFVPVAGESENGFRKLIAEHADEGLKGISIGQSPGLVAISMKAAISALEGNPMPQLISVPLPVADLHDAEGRRELLVGPARQLLHRQRVPALRREHLRPRDHGADRGRHVTHPPAAPRPPASAMASRSAPRPAHRRLQALPGRPRPRRRRLRLPPRHRSTPSSARTAPASRR